MANETFETYAADAQKSFAEQSQQFASRMEDAAEFAKGNVDAWLDSAAKASEGMQAIATEMFGFMKNSMDHNVAAFKELSQSKDASEFVERQTAMAKNSMETMAKQAQRLNEMAVVTAKESVEPMNARMAAVGELVKTGYKA